MNREITKSVGEHSAIGPLRSKWGWVLSLDKGFRSLNQHEHPVREVGRPYLEGPGCLDSMYLAPKISTQQLDFASTSNSREWRDQTLCPQRLQFPGAKKREQWQRLDPSKPGLSLHPLSLEESMKGPPESVDPPHPTLGVVYSKRVVQGSRRYLGKRRRRSTLVSCSQCAPAPYRGASMDVVELLAPLAETSKMLSAPEHTSGASPAFLHSGLPKPSLLEECGKPQSGTGTEFEMAQACAPWESRHRREPETPEPSAQKQPMGSEPCSSMKPGALQTYPRGRLQCKSPPLGLRPPTSQAGPSNLPPQTLVPRQHLRAYMTAIHCFHEVSLGDKCPCRPSQAPPSSSTESAPTL
ncbi:Tastin, partial [Galemys pyrenaicus]